MKNNYAYFQNKDCEYYPCHKAEGEDFNCLFCFCPLYSMGRECGGNFTYTEDGIKDCSACSIPHSKDGYDYIVKKCPEIIKKIKEEADNGEL